MKKTLLFLSFLILTATLVAQTPSPKEEEAVKQLIQDAFDEIWSNMDSTKILIYHTDDFVLLEHGEVWDNQAIKNYMIRSLKSEDKSQRVNSFEFLRFKKSKKSIWVAYHNYAKGMEGEKIVWQGHWLESAVAVKTKEGWKLEMMHSTRIPENNSK